MGNPKPASSEGDLEERYLLEEMKQVYEGIRLHQSAYVRLEVFSFAGIAACYGFLLSGDHPISPAVWWFIPILIAIAASRSFGHYLAIRARNGPYLAVIERRVYGNRPDSLGFQRRISQEAFWVSRVGLILGAWVGLVIASLAIAIWPRILLSDPPAPKCVPEAAAVIVATSSSAKAAGLR